MQQWLALGGVVYAESAWCALEWEDTCTVRATLVQARAPHQPAG